jgi:hypothetical protein
MNAVGRQIVVITRAVMRRKEGEDGAAELQGFST